jgi:hypothetical protein
MEHLHRRVAKNFSWSFLSAMVRQVVSEPVELLTNRSKCLVAEPSRSIQVFLDEFALQNPHRFFIMVLDNGAFHKAGQLTVPENVRLVFLPPYSPELNASTWLSNHPAEKIWHKFKRAYTNKLFESVKEMRNFISELAISLKQQEVITICKCKYSKKNNGRY